jgi:hypothetical protein
MELSICGSQEQLNDQLPHFAQENHDPERNHSDRRRDQPQSCAFRFGVRMCLGALIVELSLLWRAQWDLAGKSLGAVLMSKDKNKLNFGLQDQIRHLYLHRERVE